MTGHPFRSPIVGMLVPLALGVLASVVPAGAQVVNKVAEPFEGQSWVVNDDSSATGTVQLVPDRPLELGEASKQSLQMEAHFDGVGFQYFRVSPQQPLVIPGVTQSVSLWVRSDGQPYGWTLVFKDGWGRTEANGQKLDWEMSKGVGGPWKKVSFNIPAGWVQPLTIDGVLVHNWDAQSKKAAVRFWIDQLAVSTDITNVDPETGILRTWKPNPEPPKAGQPAAPPSPAAPLLSATLTGTGEHNVFSGTAPSFILRARNWRPEPAAGTLSWKVTDYHGTVLKEGIQALKVDDSAAVPLPLDTPAFGVYKLDTTLNWEGGKKAASSQSYAVIPVAKELTEAQKDASPYGLNVEGAGTPMISTFRKAGIIWYRDYGFSYDWMVRAKGADKSYNGWPYYPKIVKRYQDSGVRVLANLQSAIKPASGGKFGPDLAWTREMAGIVLAFPYLNTFELDNEYDLGSEHARAEIPTNWKNYRAYHKKFGDILQLLGGGQFTAVENGRAGIWPERVREAVQSGDFASIDVVNSHHYTGVDPPEVNMVNQNMPFDPSQKPLLFFDQLREVKKAGQSDGKLRQHWLTEFGWDTKAGPVVSPLQQAVYLPRAYMLLAAAGTAKGFWFFDQDSPNSNQFFDGCGLFTYDQQPKLSYAAFAGMTQILPNPEYIGMINAGPGTWGYLFRNDGKLVASIWSLTGKERPTVHFPGAKLFDFLANPLEGDTAQPGIEPVYAVGVSESSDWFRQAAYSLETPYLVTVSSGDTITVQLHVKDIRPGAIHGRAQLQLPAGWTDESGEAAITVEPGKAADIPLRFRVGPTEPLGEKTVNLAISEDRPLFTIPLRVQIQQPLLMAVHGLKGEPGNSEVSVRIANRSAQLLDGTVHFHLPASWSTPTPDIQVAALKPGEVRDLKARVQWTPDWKAGESAGAAFTTADGRSVQQPLIPSRLTIPHVQRLTLDGNLAGWPTTTQLPSWVLGSTTGDSNAEVYLGWSGEGLYVGVHVHDSKGLAPDPKSFWVGDVLELFVDTHDRKTARKFEPGDHQFWLVPQFDDKKVYGGQWKRGNEIEETKYNLAGIQGTALREGDGYVMQCLIPAALIQGFHPAPGARLGLNLNLSVKGLHADREVYWTLPKSDGAPDHPEGWGTVILGP